MGNTASAQTVSNVFNQTVNNYISNTLINISQTTQNIISGKQTLTISDLNCAGGVTISGITQTAVNTINTSALQSAINASSLQNMLQNATTQGATAVQNAANGFAATGGTASTSDINNLINNNINNVAQSYTYSDFQNQLNSIAQAQTINIGSLVSQGTCDITNIDQNMVLENLAKTISDSLTKQVAAIANSTVTGQTTSSTNTSANTGPIQDVGTAIDNPINQISSTIEYAIIGGVLFMIFVIIIVLIFVLRRGSNNPSNQMYNPYMTNPPIFAKQ
jgi:hypothetical protein